MKIDEKIQVVGSIGIDFDVQCPSEIGLEGDCNLPCIDCFKKHLVEKIKIIESMGIDWEMDCPSNHGLVSVGSGCAVLNRDDVAKECSACWIKSLEGKPNAD